MFPMVLLFPGREQDVGIIESGRRANLLLFCSSKMSNKLTSLITHFQECRGLEQGLYVGRECIMQKFHIMDSCINRESFKQVPLFG